MNEPSLLKLYMDLTGVTESTARSVLMFVCPGEAREAEDTAETPAWQRSAPVFVPAPEPAGRRVIQELAPIGLAGLPQPLPGGMAP